MSIESDSQWIDVAASDAIKDNMAMEVVFGTQIVAIFRVDGALYALDGMCAHQGGPIAEGNIQDGCVTCPWHGWQYELATGIQTINRKPLQKCFEVKEEDERIWIKD